MFLLTLPIPSLGYQSYEEQFGVFPFFLALGHPSLLNLAHEGAGKASSVIALETKDIFTVSHSGYLTAEQGGDTAVMQQFREIHCIKSKSVTITPSCYCHWI